MSDPLMRPLELNPADAIRQLQKLLDWYGSQEVAYYKKLWGDETERDSGAFCTGTENEWARYRTEAAALRAGIIALGGSPVSEEVK